MKDEEDIYYQTSLLVFQSVCTVLGYGQSFQKEFPVAHEAWTRQGSRSYVHHDDEEVCIIMSQILNEGQS